MPAEAELIEVHGSPVRCGFWVWQHPRVLQHAWIDGQYLREPERYTLSDLAQTVNMGTKPLCDCPDNLKGNSPCKHILFILYVLSCSCELTFKLKGSESAADFRSLVPESSARACGPASDTDSSLTSLPSSTPPHLHPPKHSPRKLSRRHSARLLAAQMVLKSQRRRHLRRRT